MRYLLRAFVALLILPASALPVAAAGEVADLGALPPSGIGTWAALRDPRGGLWAALYHHRKALFLVSPDAGEIPLMTDPQAAPSGLALAPAGKDRVWAAFRNKLPTRDLYLVRSDAPKSLFPVGRGTLPLARIRLAADPQGGAWVLWYGERPVKDAPDQPYWLYLNHIDAQGEAGTPRRVLPGVYPTLIPDGAGGLVIFSWYRDAGRTRVAMRHLGADGVLGPERSVATVPQVSPPLGAFLSAGRWFVYWETQYGEYHDDLLIEGAYSEDGGRTWHRFSLDPLRHLDVRDLSAAADGSGGIALALAGRWRNPGEPLGRFTAFLVRSQDNGAHWEAPLELRPASSHYSNAPEAKAAFVGPKKDRLLVLVEDWRNIRAQVRYWLTAPGGKAWAVRDAAMPLPGRYSYTLGYSDPGIHAAGKRIDLLMERKDDAFTENHLIDYRLTLDELTRLEPPAPAFPDLARLKSRVNAYGQALVGKDYQAAYDLFDPFYRARVDFLGFLKTQGRIRYEVAEYQGSKLQGPVAEVQFHIRASVPKFRGRSGRELGAPERDVVIPVRWLWIDGDWYMEYRSEARGIRYTRY